MLTYSDPILSADGRKAIFNNGRPYGQLLPTISAAAASGLQSWSQNAADVLIFSAYRADSSKQDNILRDDHTLCFLRASDVPHKSARGAYKGKKERCIIVRLDNARIENLVRGLAADCGQESVLYVKANNSARLETPRGDFIEYLGKLVTVTKQEAKQADAYTKTNGCYYICRHAARDFPGATKECNAEDFDTGKCVKPAGHNGQHVDDCGAVIESDST